MLRYNNIRDIIMSVRNMTMSPRAFAYLRCFCDVLYSFFVLIISCTVLKDGLKRNFGEVSVRVADCPDLTAEPWCLAAPGKNNHQSITPTHSHTHTHTHTRTHTHTSALILYWSIPVYSISIPDSFLANTIISQAFT